MNRKQAANKMRRWFSFIIVAIILLIVFSFQRATIKVKKPDGEMLFKKNCGVCHSAGENYITGPGLKGETSKYNMKWLTLWVWNSQSLYKSGDKDAVRIINNRGGNGQTVFEGILTAQEVTSIFNYIDEYNKVEEMKNKK